MFWGFQRRAMGQALRLLTEPLSANTQGLDAIVATSTGLSAMAGKEANSWAKLKDLTRAQKAMKEAMRSEAEGDDELKRVYPWWASKASSKTFLWTTEMSEKEKLAWEKTGKKATYRAHTLPAFTPLEMADIFASSMEAVANGFRTGGFSGAATSTVKAGLDFAAEGGGSFTEPMLQSVVDELFGQETQFKQEGTRLTKFSDKFFLDSMPFLTGGTYPDKDRPGAVRVNKGVHTLYKLFLPLSYEAVNFVEPAAEAYNVYGDDASLALIHMGQQYSGIFQSYVHDPEAQVVSDKKALERKASTSETEWKKRQGVVPND
jgi:hypothetical protein